MPRAPRPSLVVTVSLSVAACASPTPSTSAPPNDPSRPAAPTSSPPPAATAASNPPPAPPSATGASGGFRAHPRDLTGHIAHRRSNGTCFVEIVESPTERRFRFDDTACPPVMGDPAYNACDNGEIRLAKDGCVCAQLGNPPKPPLGVSCPQG